LRNSYFSCGKPHHSSPSLSSRIIPALSLSVTRVCLHWLGRSLMHSTQLVCLTFCHPKQTSPLYRPAGFCYHMSVFFFYFVMSSCSYPVFSLVLYHHRFGIVVLKDLLPFVANIANSQLIKPFAWAYISFSFFPESNLSFAGYC